MEFDLTPDQQTFAKNIREWARGRLAPGYLERAQSNRFPHDVHKEMGEMGLLGIIAPEEAGGQGADYVTAGILAEEIAYADFTAAFLVLAGSLGWEILWRLGSDEAKEWGKRVIAGEALVAAALTEPGAGSDLANVKTRAEKTADGWLITGEKTSISLAGVADAALLLARIEGKTGAQGTGLFLVPLDDPRIGRQEFDDPGFKPAGRGALFFDRIEIPDSLYLANDGRGFHEVMQVFDFSRSFLGLMCLGCARASLDEAAEYSKVREAFGKPIARYQGVSFPIAEYDTYLRAARFICYEALWRRDNGLPHTKEAAASKWFAPEIAFKAAHEALLLHGNVGYTSEAPFAQRMLDIMSCHIGDGTAQIQKTVIAREILGRDFKSY